jgi:hypothetical protein
VQLEEWQSWEYLAAGEEELSQEPRPESGSLCSPLFAAVQLCAVFLLLAAVCQVLIGKARRVPGLYVALPLSCDDLSGTTPT